MCTITLSVIAVFHDEIKHNGLGAFTRDKQLVEKAKRLSQNIISHETLSSANNVISATTVMWTFAALVEIAHRKLCEKFTSWRKGITDTSEIYQYEAVRGSWWKNNLRLCNYEVKEPPRLFHGGNSSISMFMELLPFSVSMPHSRSTHIALYTSAATAVAPPSATRPDDVSAE